jgi:hypothetical protein
MGQQGVRVRAILTRISIRESWMNQTDLITDIMAAYRKHGWQLQRVLLRSETRADVLGENATIFGGATIDKALIDALWFSRASHGNRKAWELRLVAESPYALFETFAANEPDELQEKTRLLMEARMREYVASSDK